jgi:16S rRNA (guanine527-N7)-methyltransferase
VVLAILRDDLRVALSESIGKKARAVGDIVARLGLDVPVYNHRAEDVLARHRFNTLVIRAVARLEKLLEWFKPHWDAFDRLLVLKGPAWVEERGEARHRGLLHDLSLRKLASYPLPGTESESVLLEMSRKEGVS